MKPQSRSRRNGEKFGLFNAKNNVLFCGRATILSLAKCTKFFRTTELFFVYPQIHTNFTNFIMEDRRPGCPFFCFLGNSRPRRGIMP